MQSTPEPDEKGWHRIEALLQLRAHWQKDFSPGKLDAHTIKMEEVDSIIYEALKPRIGSMLRGIIRGHLPEEILQEIAHETIRHLFNAYASFRGEASLKTYVAVIARNLAHNRRKKLNREKERLLAGDEGLIQAANSLSVQAFRTKEKTEERADTFARFQGRIFELIDFRKQELTGKELAAVVMKLAATQMKPKPTDEEFAEALGMTRANFLKTYGRGRDKIYRYWKERPERER